MHRVYFDANATTPLLQEVVEAMQPYWTEHFGNASSIHLYGQEARKAIEKARATLAEFFNCREAEVVFNSGGTEGDNTALYGILHPGDHLITSSIEHSAVLAAARKLDAQGVTTTFVNPEPNGLMNPEAIRRAVRPNTRLISIMHANNETGVIQPLKQIGSIAAESGISFHIDGVQAAGKIPIDVREIGCHLYSISAHKMHGPKGTGALFIKSGTPFESVIVGGSHERRRRAGTENVAGIVGLGRAAEIAMKTLRDGAIDRLRAHRDRLEAGLLQIAGTGVNGSGAPRTANTANIRFDDVEAEALVIALDLKGIAVSGGSACHSGKTEPSHVLMAMGMDANRARSSLRFSLLKTVSAEDVDYALSVIPEAVTHLRALSPAAAGTRG